MLLLAACGGVTGSDPTGPASFEGAYAGDLAMAAEADGGQADTCLGTLAFEVGGGAVAGEMTCDFQGAFSSFGTTSGVFDGTVDAAGSVAGTYEAPPLAGGYAAVVDGSALTGSFAGELELSGFPFTYQADFDLPRVPSR